MKRVSLTIVFAFQIVCFFSIYASTIKVAEGSLKIKPTSEEVFFYAFAAGDEVVFSFDEINGEVLNKIEIIELPSTSKLMGYQTEKLKNKTIQINKTGVYKFCFTNTAYSSRICNFNIRRVPADKSTKSFDTSVKWRNVFDTAYIPQQERYVVKSDTTVANLTNMVAKVHGSMNFNGNRNSFNFIIPENTVSWSYYIGVDQEGQQAYENATTKLSKYAGTFISHIAEYGPLAAVAIGGASYISQLQTGEDIDFYILDNSNIKPYLEGRDFSYIKKGKVINDCSRMTYPLKGVYHICLTNDNAVKSVSVTVKIVAIVVNKQWGMRQIKKMEVTSRKEPYTKG